METFIQLAAEYAHYCHYILFGLLILGGLNIPVSEDVILLVGGMTATACVPENTLLIFFWLYLGCIMSAWEAYWIGRLAGPKLYRIPWVGRLLTKERMESLSAKYEKYGFITFFVVRYIPGGVRNAFFMTAGMGAMPFARFAVRDAAASLAAAATLFYLGIFFGEFSHEFLAAFKFYQKTAAVILVVLAGIVIAYKRWGRRFVYSKNSGVETADI